MSERPRSIIDLPEETVELFKRERQVLYLLCQRQSNKLIADELEISELTVRNTITRILKKLSRWCEDRTDLMIWALQHPEAVRTGFTRRPAIHKASCDCANGCCREMRDMGWAEAA